MKTSTAVLIVLDLDRAMGKRDRAGAIDRLGLTVV